MLKHSSKKYKIFLLLAFVSATFTVMGCSKNSSAGNGLSDGQESGEGVGGQPNTVNGSEISIPCESKRYFDYLNAYRKSLGRKQLAFSSKLFLASQWHAEDMALNRYLDHTDSLGRDPSKRAAAFGYPIRGAFGENAAVLSFPNAEKVFCAWKNSPGHHANMISANFIGISVGLKTSVDNVSHWSTAFTGVSVQGDFKTPKSNEAKCAPIGAVPGC